nr:hypothetical protein Iba_chr11cCG2900 [Ipomoea batatas]
MNLIVFVLTRVEVLIIHLQAYSSIARACQENCFGVIKYLATKTVLRHWHEPLPIIRDSHVMKQVLSRFKYNPAFFHTHPWKSV